MGMETMPGFMAFALYFIPFGAVRVWGRPLLRPSPRLYPSLV